MKEKTKKLLRSFLSFTPEMLFVGGLIVLLGGFFMIGTTFGTISTGTVLVVLSFLIGGEQI